MRLTLRLIGWMSVALATLLFALPSIAEARGCGGGGGGGRVPAPRPSAPKGLAGGTSQGTAERGDRPASGANPRIAIAWREFALAVPAEPGYAETAAPLAEMIGRAVEQAVGKAPALVFIVDERQADRVAAVEQALSSQDLAVALERFVCLKASVDSIPDEQLREDVRRRAPLVYTFDSAGTGVSLVAGRRAGSRSALFAGVQKAFQLSYTLSLRDYTRAALKIRDRIEEIQAERQRIFVKMGSASEAKRAALQRDLDRLDAVREKVREEEQALAEACALRLPPEVEETASK